MRTSMLLAVGALLSLSLGTANAADIPGSKDPPGFKRFEGSEIFAYFVRTYDKYTLARAGAGQSGPFEKAETIEGQVTRVVYRAPGGHTSLEVIRNYESMLSDASYSKTFELAPEKFGYVSYWNGDFWFNVAPAGQITPWAWSGGVTSTAPYYLTAKGTSNGRDVNVAVFAVEVTAGATWTNPATGKGVPIQKGDVIVVVDAVAAKAVVQQMVEVKAADMADALAAKGTVDLYGILFDVDKTDIKPESTKTLDEVASLLKIDRSLKLEISGHTDNTGGAEHNLKLSEGRAAAVVDTLVKKYRIDAARLQPKGYGDTKPVADNATEAGKAKNRRVELKKI